MYYTILIIALAYYYIRAWRHKKVAEREHELFLQYKQITANYVEIVANNNCTIANQKECIERLTKENELPKNTEQFIDLYIKETGYGMDMWSVQENAIIQSITKMLFNDK